MTDITFFKTQGLGNDFVIVDPRKNKIPTGKKLAEFAMRICDRHYGVGGDGLILIWPSKTCDIRMQIINSDGSEPQMCGNGIRVFAKVVFEAGLLKKKRFTVETLAGEIVPELTVKNGKVVSVTVDMGQPILEPKKIPVKVAGKQALRAKIEVLKTKFVFTAVSMGNPHAVVFLEDLSKLDFEKYGPAFERHLFFPERVNTEFVEVKSKTKAVVKVWERGAGPTLACGTGACAVLVAGVLEGRLARKAEIFLPGGPLLIEWRASDDRVMMTGPATTVFEGRYRV